MSTLDALLDEQIIRPLDWHFARWLSTQHPAAQESQLLMAALVSQQLGEGHVCVDVRQLHTLWQPSTATTKHVLAVLAKEETASWQAAPLFGKGEQITPLVYDNGRIYLYRYWQAERQVARRLQRRAMPYPVNTEEVLPLLDALFAQGSQQPDWQRVAALTAASRSVALISGGPGTGKTTTVTRMLAIFIQLVCARQPDKPPLIRLAAPTGKAAARLSESIAQAKDKLPVSAAVKALIPDQGETLHRLLGARPGQTRYRHHEENPLHLDMLVVDEASMIDLPMMDSLLAALPQHARLVLIGDKQQLASVEAGSVLGDLCAQPATVCRTAAQQALLKTTCQVPESTGQVVSFADSVAFLQHSYRFDAQSGIGALASAINAGSGARVRAVLKQGFQDLTYLPTGAGIERLLTHMQEQYQALFAKVQAGAAVADVLKTMQGFQVLCGLRRGPFGVVAVNEAFEARLQQQGVIQMQGRWYAGRPVMITRNDPSLKLYNGDMGIALPEPNTGRLQVWFEIGGALVAYSTSRLPQHETVYAMTVHKSQGSEFDRVTLVVTEVAQVISRELVYTGVTRAKQQCTLFGNLEVLCQAAEQPTVRMSGLAERIWQPSQAGD